MAWVLAWDYFSNWIKPLLRDQLKEQRLQESLAGDVGQDVFEPLTDDARTEI